MVYIMVKVCLTFTFASGRRKITLEWKSHEWVIRSVLTRKDKGHYREQLSGGTNKEHCFSVLRSVVSSCRHLLKGLSFSFFLFFNMVVKKSATYTPEWFQNPMFHIILCGVFSKKPLHLLSSCIRSRIQLPVLHEQFTTSHICSLLSKQKPRSALVTSPYTGPAPAIILNLA